MPSLSTLPPDLIEMILDEIGIVRWGRDVAFVTFNSIAQLSRSLYLPAKRRLMKNVHLSERRGKLLFFPLVFDKKILGELVKSLSISFKSYEPLSVEYLSVLALLPNLRTFSLSLNNNESPYTGLDSMLRRLPQFPSITGLSLSFSLHQKEDIIDCFVKALPNLYYLTVFISGFDKNEDVNNLSTSLITNSAFPFYSFSCCTEDTSYQETLEPYYEHYEETLLSRFNLSCFSRLNEFNSSDITPDESVLPVLKSSASTLESLCFRTSEPSLSSLLAPILLTLTSLKEFNIFQDEDFSADASLGTGSKFDSSFFSYIPSSLKKMDVVVDITHLQHLQLHPRPDLKLNKLTIGGIDVGIFDHLPETVLSVELAAEDIEVEAVYQKVKSKKEDRTYNLESITFGYQLGDSPETVKEVWVENFKKIGVAIDFTPC